MATVQELQAAVDAQTAAIADVGAALTDLGGRLTSELIQIQEAIQNAANQGVPDAVVAQLRASVDNLSAIRNDVVAKGEAISNIIPDTPPQPIEEPPTEPPVETPAEEPPTGGGQG